MYIQYVQLPGTTPAPVARFKRLFLFAELVGVCFFLFFILGLNNTSFFSTTSTDEIYSKRSTNHSNEPSTIRTKGCLIPFMRPIEPSFKHLIGYPKSLKPCQANPLVGSNKTHIWIKKENMHFYNISDHKTFTCCYKSFIRPVQVDDITSSSIDNRVKYRECKNFSDGITVTDEFVRISCGHDEVVFDTFLLFAREKKIRNGNQNKKLSYNILMMGIDAVSRLNLHRTMPKTVDYLKNLGAIELLGYNKVGDNTFPNLIPMLMGKTDAELRETCTPNHRSTFDNCPFVWEWFGQAGFATALAEDTASLGTFNYNLYGFKGTPTDYYIHTFMHEAENEVGTNKMLNCKLCMNEKYFFEILLDYVDDLTTTLKSKIFGFFWETTMSHDFLNYPMVMDQKYVEVLSRWHLSGYLNETILFLVSDHGIRWGELRSTKQGYLEERLPFVFALMPPSFHENYSEAYHNLKLNSHRLTTPFDLHATLRDLVSLDEIKNEMIMSRSKEHYAEHRGISWFLPIPENRTCKSAEIDDHWCTCHRIIKSSTESVEAREAAQHIVSHMNYLVRDYPQCANLTVGELLNVAKMVSGNVGDEMVWPELNIVLRAEPSGGVFEATVGRGSGKWVLAGSVSRLNLYGDQSRCVSDNRLKLYCYCT